MGRVYGVVGGGTRTGGWIDGHHVVINDFVSGLPDECDAR